MAAPSNPLLSMTKKRETVSKNQARPKKEMTLKVFGVGGAGCNAVEHIAQCPFPGVGFTAVNTDIQSLLDLSVDSVLPLGAMLTRGLGAGGDPEVGRAAAGKDADLLRTPCAGGVA